MSAPAATVTFQNPPGECTTLLSITSMAIGDFSAGTKYLGQEGVITASLGGATPFDMRPYSRVLLLIKMGALTGGSTPAIEWDYYHLAFPDTTNAVHGLTITSIPAAGGIVTASFGQSQPSTNGNGSGGTANFFSTTSTLVSFATLLPYGRIAINATGTPTGLTAPNYLYLYGITNR